MIVVHVVGGLGNQLFQYALGRRLALDRNVALTLDLGWFASQNKRKFSLDKYKIIAGVASEGDILRVRNFSRSAVLNKAFKFLERSMPYWKRREVIEESSLFYDRNILNAPKNCMLFGYWQSEKYFDTVGNFLREELVTDIPMELFPLVNEMSWGDSVSVHIRRGDYVTENSNHLVCPIDYYTKSIELIAQKIQSPRFYVFSDDNDWVLENFRMDYPFKIVEPKWSDVINLHLMSCCHHHVNANSSFSWWGAWLGEAKDSIVIVPKRWFIDRPFPKDRVPDRWIRI